MIYKAVKHTTIKPYGIHSRGALLIPHHIDIRRLVSERLYPIPIPVITVRILLWVKKQRFNISMLIAMDRMVWGFVFSWFYRDHGGYSETMSFHLEDPYVTTQAAWREAF